MRVWMLLVCGLVGSVGYAGSYAGVLIRDVPHVRQLPDFCGEACAEMYLRKLGASTDQRDVFGVSGLDPAKGRGCYSRELYTALGRLGIETGRGWYRVSRSKAAAEMELQWKALHADLAKGVPSIVCMHYDDRPGTTEHFRLVLGYDKKADSVIYHEPAENGGAYQKMARSKFMKLWPLKYRTDTWTVIRFRMEPKKLKSVAKSPAGFSKADYAQHVMKLKERLPSKDFSIVLQPPFVVVGDESPERVRQRATGTVKWATDLLKKDYFKKDPNKILDVWLFKDRASYNKHNVMLFGGEPSTPYGYYSRSEGALVMNIATGGGTLVHEIVHPFMESNFPECPGWFNEGMGSLYEQSRQKNNQIHGSTNWRLAGLQKAIKKGHVPSFEKLTNSGKLAFYVSDPGTNYAQARYLLYYLQERKLLRQYYQDFVRNHESDPTGYDTLKKTLKTKDMKAFQKDWEKWVLTLRFPSG